MKYLSILMAFFLWGSSPSFSQDIPKSIYDFKVESLTGGIIDFSNFKGKKVLIVNTASKCGLTPQYEELEKLHQEFGDQVAIIGFPANNFMKQEPGTNQEIAEFCEQNYGVSFLMASKISVKGKNMAPIYQWLTNKDYNQFKNSSVKWNFQKYLIDENGQLTHIFSSRTKPYSEEIIEAIRN